jgi:hypothetical protein
VLDSLSPLTLVGFGCEVVVFFRRMLLASFALFSDSGLVPEPLCANLHPFFYSSSFEMNFLSVMAAPT